MAADTDPYAEGQSINMLNGNRWGVSIRTANKTYMMPQSIWDGVKSDEGAMLPYLKYFINEHYNNQLPRILELERYYKGQNDIYFANTNKSSTRADNRIATGFPKFITNIRVGYSVGNPIKFQYNQDDGADDNDLENSVDKFNTENDEEYHEKVMKKNLSVTGRAYELEYVREGTNNVAIKSIDPANAFVVYDTTIEQHSLFAVRYYLVNFMKKPQYFVEVYTDDTIYYFTAGQSPSVNLKFDHKEEHYFFAVPLTEYINNDDRMGDWEASLDKIDGIDKSVSEMTNSQEDFSNAILAINGDFDVTNEDGTKSDHPAIDTKARVAWLKPSIVNNLSGTGTTVIPASMEYVTKDVNVADWKIYIDWLAAQIHKDTNTPDTSDENFASNASGVAMSYKLWGNDQERSMQQALYTRGLMRRLRILGNYLEVTGQIPHAENVENFKIKYTPNLPKNDQEIINNAVSLVNTGKVADSTIQDYLEPVTGHNSDAEKALLDQQNKDELDKDPLNKLFTRIPDDNQQDSSEVKSDETNEETGD